MEPNLKTKLSANPALYNVEVDVMESTETHEGGPEYEINSSTNNKKPGIKSINLSGHQLIITAELSGVFCQGIQYYDLKNIQFINNTGMANLIDLLKSLLVQGVEVRFVNVNERIKEKIRLLGLEHILICT